MTKRTIFLSIFSIVSTISFASAGTQFEDAQLGGDPSVSGDEVAFSVAGRWRDNRSWRTAEKFSRTWI